MATISYFESFSFHKDVLNGGAPYFVFGDFNFRCDTEGVVKVKWVNPLKQISIHSNTNWCSHVCFSFTLSFVQKLAEDLTIHRILNVKNDHYKVQYRDAEAQNVLTIGKKEFHHLEHQIKFKESWVKLEKANRTEQSAK